MINEIISMNSYGIYVWSAFLFTLCSFAFLYVIIKIQLLQEIAKFETKFTTLSHEKKQTAKIQETYRELLSNTSNYKI